MAFWKWMPVFWLSIAAFAKGPEPQVVSSVDLDRYSGFWYEIARYPTFFQRDCLRSTADYKRIAADRITVLNTCIREHGLARTIKGQAKVADPQVNAKLKVSFGPFRNGDYWIIDLDPDYRYAVVSGPSEGSLFILAREAPMNPELLEHIKQQLAERGFEIDRLVYDRY